jgi:hypothetical protein
MFNMEIVTLDFFGVGVDVPFGRPQGVGSAKLEDFGAALCDPATGIGLRSEQIRLRRRDDLFDYELIAHFFGENGSLTRTADRAKLNVRNGRTVADWQAIQTTLIRFFTILDIDPKTVTTLATHAHVKFPTTEERDSWLGQFSPNPLISRPAGLGYVRIADWEKDIRVLMEQSNVVPDGVFIAWDTQFPNGQDWETFLPTLPTMMENSANLFGLAFEPMRERV